MPLPLNLDKLLSFGNQVSRNISNTLKGLSNRIDTTFKGLGAASITTIKFLTIAGVVATGVSLAIVGGILAFSAVASLGTIGALTVSFLTAGAIGFTLTQVVNMVVNTTNFVFNFNVNASDAELDAALEAKVESFYGLLGSAVGSSMGYLVCGALPGAIAFAFNPAVGATIMRELDDEAKSEVYGHINAISRMAHQTLINATLTDKFKSSRRFLKKNPNNLFAKGVKNLMGEDNWKKWGESNRPSWTIHQDVIQKRIEAIPDKGQRQFFEEALEEFADTCLEASHIVANTLDTQMAAQALMRSATLGNNTDVKITFA
ncbi:MAG: hypothetical protein ACR2LR_13050 [Hassallia sp.]